MVQEFALNKAFYTPSYFDDAPEKTKKYYYGSRFHLLRNKELLNLFIKQAELKFKVKINDVDWNSGIDLRNLDPDKKPNIHVCNQILPKGSLVVFPSFVWHRVKPVTKGTRHSLVIWNLGYPFK